MTDIKKYFAAELRWLFYLTFIPVVAWILITIMIHVFSLSSETCKDGEVLSYNFPKNYCSEKKPSERKSENPTTEPNEVGDSDPQIREADPPVIPYNTLNSIHAGFLIAVIFLYPIGLLIRLFNWAFHYK